MTYWGMAVFYSGGIAQSQHPLDGRKGAANPGSEVKELFLPLTQINLQAQLSPTIAAEIQYYFDWANTRAPEGGTYLGPADLSLQGPQQVGINAGNLQRRAPLEPDDQQAAPDRNATQIVSASPLRRTTSHKAETAPMHTGNNRIAMIVLDHFGMAEFNHKPTSMNTDKLPGALPVTRR